MRLIDADALVKTINDMRCADCPENGEDRCAICQWDDVIKMVISAQTIDQKPTRESRAMLPCKCGSRLREHWYSWSAEKPEILRCWKCGITVSGKNEMDVIREWNRTMRLKQTAKQTAEGETLCD